MGSFYKKIDKSFFKGKITIPNEEISGLIDASKWEIGHSENIKIIFEKENFSATIAYKPRDKKVVDKGPYYQLSYKEDLQKKLKKKFIHTFSAALSQELTAYKEGKKYHITSDEFNQEILRIKSNMDKEWEFIPFLVMKTPYDGLFEQLIEWNTFNLDNKQNDIDLNQEITLYSSPWHDIKDLKKYKDVNHVIYYLVDTVKKEIYIGCCDNLGKRVKPKRKEIPGWNMFKYEVLRPSYHGLKKRIEAHSIRAFASFLENAGGESPLKISEYKLNNNASTRRKK